MVTNCSNLLDLLFIYFFFFFQDASSSEIKKAYRKKTLILHPDKNEAPDAEEKFRKVKNLALSQYIMKTCLYNFDPRKPHFYTINLGFTGAYIIFLVCTQKYRLWV